MPSAIIAGGGLAGLAAAATLGEAGWTVDVLEARPFPGGRATSYPLPGTDGEAVDNCQHILLRCCTALLDFYRRLGVADAVRFHGTYYFIEPGGNISELQRGSLPAPAHLAGSFLRMGCFTLSEKMAIARAIAAIALERRTRAQLDRITMLDWLREQRQPPRAIARFWNQVLVSAVNEELDRMAASHGIQVFRTGFLGSADSYEMGVPAVPLGELYSARIWERFPNVRLHLRTPVDRIEPGPVVTAGGRAWRADACICALPFERVPAIVPEAGLTFEGWEHSPITGIHLWFDRPVTDLPHGTLLDRTIQWFFNKSDGRYLQLVVSASRRLLDMPRQEVIALAVRELAEFLPGSAAARLEKAHVVKEVRATFSARPGLDAVRPGPLSRIRNLYFAGDWTATGWPATMEGAVRSGNAAAAAACGFNT